MQQKVCALFGFPSPRVTELRTFSYLRFGLVVVGSCLLLAARLPSMLLAPQLIFEDGRIFFAQAYNLGHVEAIIQVYGGYWHLLPRLIAEVGSFLPVAGVPLFYHVTALVISGLAVAWFYLPHFRHLVAQDWLRLAFVMLMVFMPDLDGLMLIAYVQWYVAVWAVLFVVMTPPRAPWLQWALALAYLAALGTAPVLLVLTPLWIIRFFCARSVQQRLWLGAIVAGSLFTALLIWSVPRAAGVQRVDPWLLGVDFIRAVSYKVFATPLLGTPLANAVIARFGWSALVGFALAAGLGLLLLALRSPARPQMLILIYMGVAATCLYLGRAAFYHYLFASAASGVASTSRYFLIGVMVLYLLLAVLADRLLRQRPQTGRWLAAGAGLLLLLYLPTFRLVNWDNLGDSNWPRYARLISSFAPPNRKLDDAAARVAPLPLDTDARYPVDDRTLSDTPRPAYLADTFPVSVPIAPPGWKMTLFLPATQPSVHTLAEGVRLLGVDHAQTGNRLDVSLFWQGDPAVCRYDTETGCPGGYTAYVHLLNAQGQRITGYDVLLAAASPRQPEDLFMSEHPIQLPPDLPPGVYALEVGLYHFAGGTRVQGSSLLSGAVPVNAP